IHKGQVIDGRYHEWHELYIEVNGARRLACISLIAPRAEQLPATAARQFLTSSLGVGRPAADARARPQATDVQPLDEPDNVQPEPLRRGKPEEAARGAPERGSEAKPEAPPLPASKQADPGQP